MELSLAVNSSLLALHKLGIYCTEPFRIPHGGKLTICCFDKTGTLTDSELIVEGIAAHRPDAPPAPSEAPAEAPTDAKPASAASKGRATAAKAASAKHKSKTAPPPAPGGLSASVTDPTHPTDPRFALAPALDAPLGASLVVAGCHSLVAADDGSVGFGGGRLLGDPMEKAALLAAGWGYLPDGTCHRAHPLFSAALEECLPAGATARPALKILKRFPFSSELKRSSAVVDVTLTYPGMALHGGAFGSGLGSSRTGAAIHAAAVALGAHGTRALVKGSPEMIRTLLASVPDGYDAAYLAHARRGKRVLALASKTLDAGYSASSASGLRRDEVECCLTFEGFLVLHCPAKPESQAVLASLASSGHALQMLTGDALLTAVHTAQTLGLSSKPCLLLEPDKVPTHDGADATADAPPTADAPANAPAATAKADASGRGSTGTNSASSLPLSALRWSRWDDAVPFGCEAPAAAAAAAAAVVTDSEVASPLPSALTAAYFRRLASRFDLCASGDGFAALQARGALQAALPHVRVLARMSPGQKEVALGALQEAGHVAMMCGDGTNDVGALKQSAVGVALVSASLVAPPPPPPPATAEPAAGAAVGSLRQRKGGRGSASAGGAVGGTTAMSARERQQKRLQERLESEMASTPSVKLGDASVAAAFTARSASVTSCVDVITQGRCTLVTTTQMFKILSLNCLVSAYALSVLHLRGVRMSDTQATVSGLITAALFLFLSFSRPLHKLAPRRPPASALAPAVLLSIGFQFAIHLRTIVQGFQLGEAASRATAAAPLEADAEFEPSLINSVLFLLSSGMLLTTFAVNYTGRPHMVPLTSNR